MPSSSLAHELALSTECLAETLDGRFRLLTGLVSLQIGLERNVDVGQAMTLEQAVEYALRDEEEMVIGLDSGVARPLAT